MKSDKIIKYCKECGRKLKVEKKRRRDGNLYDPYSGKEEEYKRIVVKCPKHNIFNCHTKEEYESSDGGNKWRLIIIDKM